VALLAVVIVVARNQRGGPKAPAHAGTAPAGSADDPAALFGPPPRQTSRAMIQAGCGTYDPAHPPHILVDTVNGAVDLGKQKQGVSVVHEVGFRNTGTGPLCIARVSTGCGCLKASLVGDKRRFEPGEGGRIRLAADTTGRVGLVHKQVTITCNDPDTPLKSFTAAMNVDAGLIAEPRYLQFGNVPPGTPSRRAVHLRTAKKDADWKVTAVHSGRHIVGVKPVTYTFEVEPIPDPRWHRVKVTVIHPGYAELGPYRDTVVIETTNKERPRIEIPAQIHVVPRIVCRTRVITLGFVLPGAPRTPTRVRIQAGATGVLFKVVGVEVQPPKGQKAGPDGPGYTAKFGKDERGWWVDVRYDGKSRKPGLLEAQLVVHTSDSLQPEVRVPIRATIRSTS
jgi:hypothetical protein